MDRSNQTLKKLLTCLSLGYFCALIWVIIADVVYNNNVPEENIQFHGLYPLSIGLSAIVTALIFDGNLKEIPFKIPGLKDIWFTLKMTIILVIVPFLINIFAGLTSYNDVAKFDKALLLGGFPVLIILALGEEIMWRGFLFSQLSKLFNFTEASLITGVFWALWHYPVIIHTHFIYADLPLWFSLPSFTLGIFGLSVFSCYLRVKTASIWPPVIWHALCNYFFFVVLKPLEINTSTYSMFFKLDTGILFMLFNIGAGFYFVNKYKIEFGK
jgi:membrane protease YdiL (CAAX protease family)